MKFGLCGTNVMQDSREAITQTARCSYQVNCNGPFGVSL
jgi:hypothetical protein